MFCPEDTTLALGRFVAGDIDGLIFFFSVIEAAARASVSLAFMYGFDEVYLSEDWLAFVAGKVLFLPTLPATAYLVWNSDLLLTDPIRDFLDRTLLPWTLALESALSFFDL